MSALTSRATSICRNTSIYTTAKVTTLVEIVFLTIVIFPFGGIFSVLELFGIWKRKTIFVLYKLRIFALVIKIIICIMLLFTAIAQMVMEPHLPTE